MEEGLAYFFKRAFPIVRARATQLWNSIADGTKPKQQDWARRQAQRAGELQGVTEENSSSRISTVSMASPGTGGPPIHPVLEQSVAFMLGTWRGEGEGGFPTIQSFKYGEEIKLWHVGKPVMAYTQKTWKAASGEPMHAESGYFRPKPDGSVEAVIAQSTGLAEVQKGSYDFGQKSMELRTSLVGNASKVLEITRTFQVEGDELRYKVGMATHSHEMQPHLQAVLKRVT